MARAMVGLYCASFRHVPRRITLDIDDTFDAVHGGQQLRLFDAYDDEYGFQPIVVFDCEGLPPRPGRSTSAASSSGMRARRCFASHATPIRAHCSPAC